MDEQLSQLSQIRIQLLEKLAQTCDQYSNLRLQYRQQKKAIQRAHLNALDELRRVTGEINRRMAEAEKLSDVSAKAEANPG